VLDSQGAVISDAKGYTPAREHKPCPG
jgi:hypothetical protein